MKTTLREAVKFHGHLGPYLILGLLAGDFALRKMKMKKYFGLEIKVWGATKKPKSCLIDGLQLATGATFGKGNIHKFNGGKIRIDFYDAKNGRHLGMRLTEDLNSRLKRLNTHQESEEFARKLYKNGLKGFCPNIIVSTSH